jgi:hypothetical protein
MLIVTTPVVSFTNIDTSYGLVATLIAVPVAVIFASKVNDVAKCFLVSSNSSRNTTSVLSYADCAPGFVGLNSIEKY